MSVPVVGPLSVTPLYTASGDRLVFWDGVEWQQIEVSAGTQPPTGSGGAGVAGGGGAAVVGGGGAPVVGGGAAVSGMQEAALMAQITALEARIAVLEGRT